MRYIQYKVNDATDFACFNISFVSMMEDIRKLADVKIYIFTIDSLLESIKQEIAIKYPKFDITVSNIVLQDADVIDIKCETIFCLNSLQALLANPEDSSIYKTLSGSDSSSFIDMLKQMQHTCSLPASNIYVFMYEQTTKEMLPPVMHHYLGSLFSCYDMVEGMLNEIQKEVDKLEQQQQKHPQNQQQFQSQTSNIMIEEVE